MAKRTDSDAGVVLPLVVYPLAAIGALSIYLFYWGKKLGGS